MHNVPALVSGRERCVLLVHPDDAARARRARRRDRGAREPRPPRRPVPVRVTDEMAPGVVSLPHGWGHAASAPVAARRRRATPASRPTTGPTISDVEAVVGQSILNGVPVRLVPAA